MQKGIELWERAKEIIPGGSQLLSKKSEMFLPDQWPSYYKSAKGVEIIECQYSDKGGKWCRIKYGNIEGWVSATYLREQ